MEQVVNSRFSVELPILQVVEQDSRFCQVMLGPLQIMLRLVTTRLDVPKEGFLLVFV